MDSKCRTNKVDCQIADRNGAHPDSRVVVSVIGPREPVLNRTETPRKIGMSLEMKRFRA